jgi:hypothetical protein
MLFVSATPSIVRSVKQRDLLNTWLRLRGRSGGLPAIADYHPARLEEEMRELVYYIVRAEGDGFQFIIDSTGSTAALAYGTAHRDNVGTSLHDFLRPEMRPLVLPLYGECASRGLPTYTISLVTDVNGRSVTPERLLLPFFHEGKISRIIASLKAISDDGKFEINNLLRDRDQLPDYTLRAVIDQELVLAQATREARNLSCDFPPAMASDVVEI